MQWRRVFLGAVCCVGLVQVMLYWWITSDIRLRQEHHQQHHNELLRPASTAVPTQPPQCTPQVKLQNSLSILVHQTQDVHHWDWVLSRCSSLWSHWVSQAQRLVTAGALSQGKRFRVMIVPGIFIATDFADKSSIQGGGPVGDLVQWADLVAGLQVLGHNVTLMWDVYQAARGLRYDKLLWAPHPSCSQTEVDLVFTDIIAVKTFPPDVIKKHGCRLRVLDAYGTEAMYNHATYALKHGYISSIYGQLGLDLRQFYTFYPHTPENSFLGFAVVPPNSTNGATPKKSNMALLYGKSQKYFQAEPLHEQGKSQYLTWLMELKLELHATVDNSTVLPPGVINHGILSPDLYQQLLAQSKYFIGLGEPLESTAAIEALANGCIFINPKFIGNQTQVLQTMGKPTSRLLSSQVTYLSERVGPPHVFTVDITDHEQVVKTLQLASKVKPDNYIPDEFKVSSFLQRLSAYLTHQELCDPGTVPWPPLSALTAVYGDPGMSCSQVCSKHGLICEYSFFKTINEENQFEKLDIPCPASVERLEGLLYPAYLTRRMTCVLQSDLDLFSCTGSNFEVQRLCPCRDFMLHQPSLCKNCL